MNNRELDQFLAQSSIERETLGQWIERRWIRAAGSQEDELLSDCDAARALFIRDLRVDFEVNDEGIDLVLHLVDQVHGLRRVLQALREELNLRD